MNKKGALLTLLVTFLLGASVVGATCDTSTSNKLNAEAVQVKASYELLTRELDPSEFTPPDGVAYDDATYKAIVDYFRIYVVNLTENLYVKVYNNVTEETTTYSYQDSENGSISIDVEDLSAVVNYIITVYSSNNTNCPDTKLYTTYLTTPRYNDNSELEVCSEATDFYLCYEYVSTEDVDFDTLVKSVEAYKAGKVNNQGEEIINHVEEEKTFGDYVKEYKVPIIIVSVILVMAIGVVVVIIVKKQRRKRNEKEN